METLGNIDRVPPDRRVGGPGASYMMAAFTHVSADRPSRFTNGDYGVLYAASAFETALAETVHHHARFMARTAEPEGWTSQFREIVLDIGRSEEHTSELQSLMRISFAVSCLKKKQRTNIQSNA